MKILLPAFLSKHKHMELLRLRKRGAIPIQSLVSPSTTRRWASTINLPIRHLGFKTQSSTWYLRLLGFTKRGTVIPYRHFGTTCRSHLPKRVKVILGLIFVNNQPDAQFFFMYIYFYSQQVSGSHVPIIRRINCINASGMCHSVQMTVWTPNGHLYRVTYTRCIDTINSPDDGHMASRNL
jgi:hypothetical protein